MRSAVQSRLSLRRGTDVPLFLYIYFMPYFTDIIYSETKDRYYIGSSEDVYARLERHNDGATPSTKPFRPWRIVWTEQHESRTDVQKRELYIKRMKSRSYIEALISKKSSAG